MASWTDGAAYAPIERPDGFATPEVEPLDSAPESTATTPGALPAPQEFRQSAPVASLEELHRTPPSSRNPSDPFLILGGLMTTASSMGRDTTRDPRIPFLSQRDAGGGPGVETLPPPTGEPLAFPAVGPPGAPVDTIPGMPMHRWTAPPSPGPPPMSSQEISTQRTLVLLGVVCCVLGFAIGAVAPYMLLVAGGLSLRASRLTGKVGFWAIGFGLVLIVFGLLLAPGLEFVYGRLACLGFGIWFTTAAVGRSRARH